MILRRSRLAAQLSSAPTEPRPTKNLRPNTPPGAIWDEAPPEKLVLPPVPDTQRKPHTRDTEELSGQVPARQTGDIVQQSQASIAQQKLDLLAEARARKKKK
jgi:hypothetical protein